MTPSHFRQVGLFAKVGDPGTAKVVAEVLDVLAEAGCQVLAEPRTAELAPDLRAAPCTDLAERTQLVIVVGGDGTLLAAARALQWAPVPLLGVNLGRLGFLADVRPQTLTAQLRAVVGGEYEKERRLMLEVLLQGPIEHEDHAVNDIVIKRRDGSRLLELEAWVGDAYLSRTRADGLIVASPTGSTAYALSAGGPILAPGLSTFAVVPICPHGLGERPVVVPAETPVRVRPRLEPDEVAEVVLDGQATFTLERDSNVLVRRSRHELLLLHPPGYEYFATLREKLGWGGRAPGC